MTRIVNVHQAKTHLSRLLEDARNGEDIIIAKGGKPYVRLEVIVSPTDDAPQGFAAVAGSLAGRLTNEQIDYLCGPADAQTVAAFERGDV